MNADLEQRRRSVRVMDLLTKSWEAYSRGDEAGSEALADATFEVDAQAAIVSTFPAAQRRAYPGRSRLRSCCLHKRMIGRRLRRDPGLPGQGHSGRRRAAASPADGQDSA